MIVSSKDKVSHQIAKTIINQYFYCDSISGNVSDELRKRILFEMIVKSLNDPDVLKALIMEAGL